MHTHTHMHMHMHMHTHIVAGTYVELGGEFYWGKFAARWPRATDYAREANEWAGAIKREYPSVSVLAVAAFCTAWARAPPTERGAARWKRYFLLPTY